jgi:hypothetical protein
MQFSGLLRRVALVRTDVSEERIASIITVTRIGELGTTLAVTSNLSTLRKVGKVGYLQQPHGVTLQKRAIFIATAVKTSYLAQILECLK